MDLEAKLKEKFKGKLFSATDAFWHTDFLQCGIPAIDKALGNGIGYGRVAEFYGPWSTGKTMLLYYYLAANQRKGGKSILFEAEGAFSEDFYATLGGDPNSLLVYPADTVEDVFDAIVSICELMKAEAKAGNLTPVLIGWDSIACTGTKHLMEAGMEKRDMSKAGAMSTGCQLVRNHLHDTRVAIIATNQTRTMIGSMSSETHTPGGDAWRFLCSQRLELDLDGGYKGCMIQAREEDQKVDIGKWTKGKVTKNKLAAPFGRFSLPIYVQEGLSHPIWDRPLKLGIDIEETLFQMYSKGHWKLPSKKLVIEQNGAWWKLEETIAPGYKNWMKKDWLEVLAKFPQLRTLPYDSAEAA